MSKETYPGQDLALRILEHETAARELPRGGPPRGESSNATITPDVAFHTFETLRLSLSKTVGVVGFQALLARALALAKNQVPWLEAVSVNEEGSLERLVEEGQSQEADVAAGGCVTLLAQLLNLLIVFVGYDLTLLLVRDVWSDIGQQSQQETDSPREAGGSKEISE